MKKYIVRIGNDLPVQWSFFQDKEKTIPLDLSGRNLSVYLATSVSKWKLSGLLIENNWIVFTIPGVEQISKYGTGLYTLTCIENEGESGQHIVDYISALLFVSQANESIRGSGEGEYTILQAGVAYLESTGVSYYETVAHAAATYETKVHAAATYETKEYAREIYETKEHARETYYQLPEGGIPESDLSERVQGSLGKAETAAQPSDLTDFITKSVDNLVNYYLKSDTYTKAEVQALISAINQFHYEIYPNLESITDPQGNVLYLIGPTGTGNDKYEEYVFANDVFTKIGDTSIDLSNYVTIDALNTTLANYTLSINIPVEKGSGTNSIQQKGTGAVASGESSVAEGNATRALGFASHAEGNNTTASGYFSHAEGNHTNAIGNSSHVEGYFTTAVGNASHVEGGDNLQGELPGLGEEQLYSKAEGYASHAEGAAHAIGHYSHAEGGGNAIEEGHPTRSTAEGPYSHAEGTHTYAIGNGSHAEGNLTIAKSPASHAEGRLTVAGTDANIGKYAHSEGFRTSALGENSHSEGGDTIAKGNSSHAEGYLSSSVGANCHSEGRATVTNGNGSHSEGYSRNLYEYEPGRTVEQIESLYDDSPFAYSSGNGTHSEGYECIAMGTGAHAEGHSSKAIAGWGVHAEGWKSVAKGDASHAEGSATETKNSGEHAEGRYNKSNKVSNNYGDAGNTRHSVGIGESDTKRKNAFEIMSNGDIYVIGLGGYNGTNAAQTGVKTLQTVLLELGA